MGKATNDELSDLHGALAKAFVSAIVKGEATPALLNVARQFLKDNGIESDISANSATSELAEKIARMDAEDEDNVVPLWAKP